MSHSDVNWPLTDFSYQYLRRLIILSRGRIFTSQDSPKKLLMASDSNPMTSRIFNTKTHQVRKNTPKHEDFVEFSCCHV